MLLKEKCTWLSHQRAPLGERASSSCMGNGQLIHLEIDSGCGAPRERGRLREPGAERGAGVTRGKLQRSGDAAFRRAAPLPLEPEV